MLSFAYFCYQVLVFYANANETFFPHSYCVQYVLTFVPDSHS